MRELAHALQATAPEQAERNIREARARAMQAFADAAHAPAVVDVALIGNASGLYPWEPTAFVDLDVCVFVNSLTPAAGAELAALGRRLAVDLDALDVDFELRIVRGPYKRVTDTIRRAVVVAHLGVFTEATYERESAFLRWGWRKYRCVIDPERLRRLAPRQPTLEQLLNGPRGVRSRLAAIESGRVEMRELHLPDFRSSVWSVGDDDPLFVEYCFAAGATCSRNHGRALGKIEADTLANGPWFAWYRANLLDSPEFTELMALKELARRVGYGGLIQAASRLATSYLRRLATELEPLAR